jgi:DNA-directed RNA polymerase subunit RPC12/RpoP
MNFTCKNCGAPLRFSPLSKTLLCEFCNTEESIEISNEKIESYSFDIERSVVKKEKKEAIPKSVTCAKCSATFTSSPQMISSNCPYCNAPIIIEFIQKIRPKSLLPFHISQEEAQKRFKKWIGSLWFAPSQLKKLIKGTYKLKGYYLPYWLYNATTDTSYYGERGDIYYVQVERTVMVNGREERQRVQESRIRWSPVSGKVHNQFDNVTIGASKRVSEPILENLNPWESNHLTPFNKKYLLGFDSEEYTIELDSGFESAKVKMQYVIRNDIKRKIGGDQQRIHQIKTNYYHTTYKSTLFPLWTAQFKWKDKNYTYAINGQTGKVTGERPYSWLKIIALILTISLLIGGAVYIDAHPELFKNYL